MRLDYERKARTRTPSHRVDYLILSAMGLIVWMVLVTAVVLIFRAFLW